MMDLAINLRTRSHGEASFSQLQIWSHGIPSVVSNIGWFKDLPDTIVTKVDPKDEKKVLHDIWRRVIQGDPKLQMQGELGREYLQKHHSPQVYADAITSTPSTIRRQNTCTRFHPAPPGFNPEKLFQGVYWFQRWEGFPRCFYPRD
jgi:hypothetical protein